MSDVFDEVLKTPFKKVVGMGGRGGYPAGGFSKRETGVRSSYLVGVDR